MRHALLLALALLTATAAADAQELRTGPVRQRLLGDGDVIEVEVEVPG